ncbi:MAG: CPBP family intramembrane metalloprotease [Oscillospiraceae bacterium]|nr:CPBP family intramembrane metalloprotease [Oscillospiraceae bacterium]
MREKLRALAIALAAPAIYLAIQRLVRYAVPQEIGWHVRVLFLAAPLGLCLAIFLIFQTPPPTRAGLLAPVDAASVVFLIILGISLQVAVGFALTFIPFPDNVLRDYSQLMRTVGGQETVVGFVAACLVVPVVEEALFRGVCQRALQGPFRASTAVILQALLFAAFHGNLVQFVGVLPVAVILGLSFSWSQTLVAPILLHIAFNSANMVLASQPGIGVEMVVLSAIGVAGSMIMLRKRLKTRKSEDEKR